MTGDGLAACSATKHDLDDRESISDQGWSVIPDDETAHKIERPGLILVHKNDEKHLSDGDADVLDWQGAGLGATDGNKIVLSQELEKMRK